MRDLTDSEIVKRANRFSLLILAGTIAGAAGIALNLDNNYLIDMAENPDPVRLTAVVGLFLFLVVVNEQVCEFIVNLIYGQEEKEMLAEIAGSEPESESLLIASSNLQKHEARKTPVAKLICVAFGLAIAGCGFHFLTLVLDALGASITTPSAGGKGLFPYDHFEFLDIVFTALILAGGADRYHKIVDSAFPKQTKPR